MTEENPESDFTNVAIPTFLVEKIKKRMEKTEFTSISNYVTYILREVISNIEAEEKERSVFSKEEEEKVKSRLKDLGYID